MHAGAGVMAAVRVALVSRYYPAGLVRTNSHSRSAFENGGRSLAAIAPGASGRQVLRCGAAAVLALPGRRHVAGVEIVVVFPGCGGDTEFRAAGRVQG